MNKQVMIQSVQGANSKIKSVSFLGAEEEARISVSISIPRRQSIARTPIIQPWIMTKIKK